MLNKTIPKAFNSFSKNSLQNTVLRKIPETFKWISFKCFHDGISLQILKIRAQTEGIQIDDDSLSQLGQVGVQTTLR